jgi:hypothetical protein
MAAVILGKCTREPGIPGDMGAQEADTDTFLTENLTPNPQVLKI